MKPKFNVGEDVAVEFMGVITDITLDRDGKISYTVRNHQDKTLGKILCMGLDEDKIIPLPTEK